MKLLILYEELAGYIISCVNYLIKNNGVEVHIIKKKINPEAPFEFSEPILATLYDRSEFSQKQLVDLIINLNADTILCCGWGHKPYLNACKKLYKKTSIVIGFDNQWQNTLRQNIASFYFKFTLKKYFKACFVPGSLQKKFGLKLGFKSEEVYTGIYSCDTELFTKLFIESIHLKNKKFPHKFIYVGRYIESKGILDLWNAFEKLQNEIPNDWELWCLGAGAIVPIKHSKIFHFGFVQPNKIADFINQTGVFILPSYFEPWGVVVHEFAVSGFPILCSNNVGASEIFVRQGENGFIFDSKKTDSILESLKKIVSMKDEEIYEMGLKSSVFGKKITLETWSKTILEIMLI
jgi:glycosyltransferase involved in cell wall biosynthesis